MDIMLKGDFQTVSQGLKELEKDLHFQLSDNGTVLNIVKAPEPTLVVSYENDEATIIYHEKSQFFRAFGLLIEHVQYGNQSFHIEEDPQFSTIGPMFDLSRNAVLQVESFKGMLRKLAVMGFNASMLYMEDTYEIKSEPYFGYMRGRYSQDELKELDDYAYELGIELIPCIQTLAHLEEFLKWSNATKYKDTRGALLLESEDTYTFVENMIQSASAPFRSKKIHIGMDEAEEVGRGIYLNKNGYKPRFELMATHLSRVLDICENNGLDATMWSDMFLKLASQTGDVYDASTEIPEYIIEQTPKNVQLMYWQYNSKDKNHYEQILKKHKAFGKTPAFAGGIWVWNTFATNYDLSIGASNAALEVCKEEGIQDVFVTLWGDDGYENNYYTALYGLQLYAEHAYAKQLDETKLNERIKFCTGIDHEQYLLLNDIDHTPGVTEDNDLQTNPSKFLLWQDVLLGLFDKHVEGLDMKTHYTELEQAIQSKRDAEKELDYIFDVPEKLCSVLALKATLGVELKQAYDAKNDAELQHIATSVLPEISERVKQLRRAHRKQWLTMHKPFGWEVLDIRYGGVISRLDTAIERINEYLAGDIEFIDELEQERLPFMEGVEDSTALGWCSYYFRIASPNVFFHVLPIY